MFVVQNFKVPVASIASVLQGKKRLMLKQSITATVHTLVAGLKPLQGWEPESDQYNFCHLEVVFIPFCVQLIPLSCSISKMVLLYLKELKIESRVSEPLHTIHWVCASQLFTAGFYFRVSLSGFDY